MTNYKVVQQSIGLNTALISVQNLKVIHLTSPAASTVDTFHDQPGNNYQVPAGKSARIINIVLTTAMTLTTEYIGYSDGIDVTTNEVQLLRKPTAYSDKYTWLSEQIPATKYPNRVASAAGDTCEILLAEYDEQ